MKYEFIKIDDDTTELRYKDKVFSFIKNVELLSNLQGINVRAKARMMNELKKMGMSAKDLVIVRKEKNKTYEDNSNLLELEEYCLSIEAELIYDEILRKYCNMPLSSLLKDIGVNIEDKDEVLAFTTKVNEAITGKTTTPREEK